MTEYQHKCKDELDDQLNNINREWVKVDVELWNLHPQMPNELPSNEWCDLVSYYFYRKKLLEWRKEKLLKEWVKLK